MTIYATRELLIFSKRLLPEHGEMAKSLELQSTLILPLGNVHTVAVHAVMSKKIP